MTFAAIVLAGGRAVRLDGADKASVEYAGRTLLEHALAALADAREVVVVGAEVPTSRPVTFCRESPPFGGPAAGLLAGYAALARRSGTVGVLAVDMPLVTPATFRRLRAAARDRDGAFLTDGEGRRQLAGVLDARHLADREPGPDAHGMSMRALLDGLDLALVAPAGAEGRDVDTWTDLRDL